MCIRDRVRQGRNDIKNIPNEYYRSQTVFSRQLKITSGCFDVLLANTIQVPNRFQLPRAEVLFIRAGGLTRVNPGKVGNGVNGSH